MTQPLEPGLCLSGHLLSEEIGQGGYSRVFRAEPVNGGPSVAIKVAVRPELVAALRAEGAVLRRLPSPRFVEILEEHLDEDPPYFVLELCPGGDLRALLEKAPGKRLPPARALELATAILEGVAFAHDEGLVHGDLKPENVLLGAAGEPKIADLGLSRAQRKKLLEQESQLAASASTEDGKVRGTFDYLAPEVRKGGEITPPSDVFALGVFLYELLVGARPLGLFRLPGEVLAKEGVAVPRALDRVVARALAHEPGDRYPDASVMLADLLAGDVGLTAVAAAERPDAGPNPLVLRVTAESFADRAVLILLFTVPVMVLGTTIGVFEGKPEVAFVSDMLAGVVSAFFLVPSYLHLRAKRWLALRRFERALEEKRA